jgi:hypothetical protein
VVYQCQPFDLNDRVLIEQAHKTGEPFHVAQAVENALAGFRRRMQQHPQDRVEKGELVVSIIAPRNFFDKFVIETVIQEFCDSTGMRVALTKSEGPPNLKQPASPEVAFISEPQKI